MNPKQLFSRSNLAIYHIGAVMAVVAWGVSFISTKVLLDGGLDPIEIYIYRSVIAWAAMLLICHRHFFARTWRHEGIFVLCGLFGGSIYFISENVALQYTLVSNVSLITSLSPMLTVLLVGVLYKNERPSAATLLGSAIAFLGVGMVIFNSSFSLTINPLGDLLSLLAAFSWAIYCILLKTLNPLYDALFITRKLFFYGVLTALPLVAIEEHPFHLQLLFTPEMMMNLLYLALFCSLFAYLMWSIIVGRIGAVKANNYMYFQPVVTLVFSYLLLDEVISVVGYTGCALILCGVFVSDHMQKRKMKRI